MSVIENGHLAQTSVSQLERFDPEQFGGCPRRWWIETVHQLKPDQGEAAKAGDAGHLLLASYLRTGTTPKGRVKMGKAVTAAIIKGELPKPGPDLLVEWRGDGQEKFMPISYGDENGPAWIPLNRERTLKIAGVPFEIFIDLTYRRGPIPHVLDHKFRGDLADCKAPEDLIKTNQMPVYVLARRPFWPDAKQWRLTHHNVCRNAGQGSRMVTTVVELDQVLEREVQIAVLVRRMGALVRATNQNDVPVNPSRARSCEAWGGCPHQSICSHYKRSDHVDLTPQEEADLFGATPPVKTDGAENLFDEGPPPGDSTAAEDDEEAAAAKALEVIRAKKAAAKAAAEAEAKAKAEAEAKAKAAAEASKTKRVPLVDKSTSPDPGSAPKPGAGVNAAPACACGEQLTPENGSKLQDGSWKHIGCPKDPTPAPQPEKGKPGHPPKVASGDTVVTHRLDPEQFTILCKLLGKG